jgi:hypothetical protein
MVFDKTYYNNWEVPLYFLCKLWAEFIMGIHVNYFDIGILGGWFEIYSGSIKGHEQSIDMDTPSQDYA